MKNIKFAYSQRHPFKVIYSNSRLCLVGVGAMINIVSLRFDCSRKASVKNLTQVVKVVLQKLLHNMSYIEHKGLISHTKIPMGDSRCQL